MKLSFNEILSERIPLLFDGAMGTELQKHDISPDDYQGKDGCLEILNITRPDIIRTIHCGYLTVGAHIVETNTFGANRFKLQSYGLESRVQELNRAAAQVARGAVEQCSDKDFALVCGTMGPTGYLPSSSSPDVKTASFDDIADVYAEQAGALLDGAVDMLLLETMQDLLEVRAAMYGIRREFSKRNVSVPVQVQVTMDSSGHMLLGSDVSAFLGAAANMRPEVLGFNCSTGPDEMMPHLKKLLESGPCAVSVIPNAGMPENVDGEAHYHMGAEEFANKVAPMVLEHGVSVVGGCCGTTRDHIALLAKLLEGKKVADRSCNTETVFIASGLSGAALHSAKRPIIVGERLNAQGSRKTKELVLENNYDELYRLGLGQQDKNAAVLDLCMAINERDDEPDTMTALVKYLSERLHVPFCIDSTDPAVFEQALRVAPGSVLINSINLEKGGDKARKICALARDFACPLICLPIDDSGMAKAIDQKLSLAEKLRGIVIDEFGIPEHYMFFDPLVFTLATGDREMANAAVDSLAALREIKKRWPKMNTLMGVSNVSFGLKPKARRVLNNLLLHHSAAAGLDAAIFNPLHVDDIESYDADVRKLAEDLLLNKSEKALEEFIQYYENLQPSQPSPKTAQAQESLSPEERMQQKILQRDRRDIAPLLQELMKAHAPVEILNKVLLPAMAEVGERMARGEMILPFVLQAAEIMKEAVNVLEPHFDKSDAVAKGKIILATVYGDIHDIGKNLVGSILKNQGYDVIDLGKQVPLEDILAAVKKEQPDALGLSALLVTTSRQMGECVKELAKAELTVPLMIGGAAVNRGFAERIAVLPDTTPYAGGVYYGKDAFEAAHLLERFKSGDKDIKHAHTSDTDIQNPHVDSEESSENASTQFPNAALPPVEYGELITPLFYGTSDMLTFDTATLLDSIDRKRLYKGYWRTGRMRGDEFERNVLTEFDPAFDALREEIISSNLVDARGYYGFWPVYTKDDTVYLLDPSDFSTEVARFSFERVARRKGRSIADWFRPEGDVIALQVVTIGGALAMRSREYFEKEDKYSMGFYLNGIGNFVAEEIADKVTVEVRRAMYITDRKQGKRYGFGYPGLPGLEHQKELLDLLCAQERLGITLTSGHQMVPEHSTVTVYVHHKDASYM